MQVATGDGKPCNCVLRIGSRTAEFGVEGHHKPLMSINMHHYKGKSLPLEIDNICLKRDYFFAENEWPSGIVAEKLEEDIKCMNYLFPPSLLAFKDQQAALDAYKYQLNFILHDMFYKSGISSLNVKVLLVWCEETPRCYLNSLVDILLKRLLVRSVVIVSDPLMCSLSAGIGVMSNPSTFGGLIIDFGWRYTRVSVVFDNRELREYSKLTIRGACNVHYNLLQKLRHIPLHFKEVEKLLRAIQSFSENSTDIIDILGNQEEEATVVKCIIETLFPSTNILLDRNELSPVDLALNVLEELPMDLINIVRSNIMIVGGFSSIPGFSTYVINELNQNGTGTLHGIHSMGSWVGASLYSKLILRHAQRHIQLPEVRRDL